MKKNSEVGSPPGAWRSSVMAGGPSCWPIADQNGLWDGAECDDFLGGGPRKIILRGQCARGGRAPA